jgi:sulfur-carrier protein
MSDCITITLKLFAAYQEAYGVPELMLEFPIGTTVQQVCDRLIAEQFVAGETILQAGDEVVLIPPVSGG